MNKKLIAAIAATTMAGAIGFASVASAAAEFHWYGSLRAGLVSGDDDLANSDSRLDLGATGKDGSVGGQGLYSRIGIKAKTDLGNGQSAGLRLERGVGDTLSVRHTNVWIGGGWGKLTFGQQGNPYRNAQKWDQTWFLGGQYTVDGGTRVEGIQYSIANGPFSFSVMAEANDASDDEGKAVAAETTTIQYYHTAVPTATDYVFTAITDENNGLNGIATGYMGAIGQLDDDGNFVVAGGSDDDADDSFIIGAGTAGEAPGDSEVCTTAGATCAVGYEVEAPGADPDGSDVASSNIRDGAFSRSRTDKAAVSAESNDGVDAWTITAGYDFGVVNLDVSHRTSEIDDVGFDNTAIGINGSVGSFGWYLVYQQADDNTPAKNDVDSIGGYVSFGLSDKDLLYFYHVSHDADETGAFGKALGEDVTESILGYSHSFGGGVSFIAEYLEIDKDLPSGTDGSDPKVLALALKVDF